MTKIFAVGNAHIDPVWLWQWHDGYSEVKATFRSALDRLNENPNFVFTSACACYYKWVEESDPEMFEEIRARIKEGRWCIVGGMWIQPDMNAPSGESLARQLLYSQRYFMEKFGVTAKVGYNVDSFGHNGMMPQIYKLGGISGYIWMRPDEAENKDIPLNLMAWQGVDGTQILSSLILWGYCTGHENLYDKLERWSVKSDELGQPMMCFYGVGNHGGGPTIEQLKFIDKYLAEAPRRDEAKYSCPNEFFEAIAPLKPQLPVWKGEYQHHASGCYSTHSLSKHKHRETENALVRAETLTSLSSILTGHKGKDEFMRQAWENLMFNEFHDVMGGCSLPEALDDCVRQYDEALSIAEREENRALQKISWSVDTLKGHPLRVRSKEEDWFFWGRNGQGTPLVVFNPHGYECEDTIKLRRPVLNVKDDDGNRVPAQAVRASRTNGDDTLDGIFRAKVPALGYRLYWLFLENNEEAFDTDLACTETVLENSCLRAEFDVCSGALKRLYNKKTGREVLSAPSSTKVMDITPCDTWAHAVFKFDNEIGVFGNAVLKLEENGPVRSVMRITTKYENSTLVLRYILYAYSGNIELEAVLDNHTKHSMIKLCFPTKAVKEISEIPFGAIERTLCGNEEHCQRWVAMQEEKGGLALINDGKYSYSAPNGEMRMTLSNTSIMADHFGQHRRDENCRFMDQGEQRFRMMLVPFEDKWQDANLSRLAETLNRPMSAVIETYHEGKLGDKCEGIEISRQNVDLSAFKRAEDDKGWIVRLYETAGKDTQASVDVKLVGRKLALSFRGFEIKTIYLPDDEEQQPKEVLFTEFEK